MRNVIVFHHLLANLLYAEHLPQLIVTQHLTFASILMRCCCYCCRKAMHMQC